MSLHRSRVRSWASSRPRRHRNRYQTNLMCRRWCLRRRTTWDRLVRRFVLIDGLSRAVKWTMVGLELRTMMFLAVKGEVSSPLHGRWQSQSPNYPARWKSEMIQLGQSASNSALVHNSRRCSFVSCLRWWPHRKMLTGRVSGSGPYGNFSVRGERLSLTRDSRLPCRSTPDSSQRGKMSRFCQCQHCKQTKVRMMMIVRVWARDSPAVNDSRSNALIEYARVAHLLQKLQECDWRARNSEIRPLKKCKLFMTQFSR